MNNLSIVIPFWNGHSTIQRLLDSLPDGLPIVIVDDHSDESLEPLQLKRRNLHIVRPPEKGFFSGAVNFGVNTVNTDVLILNQDAYFESDAWMNFIAENRDEYGVIGEGVLGHPAWPKGYVQGTFMCIRRDAWNKTGPFNEEEYPLWGSTCEWQLRMCRQGFKALPVRDVPGFVHKYAKARGGYRFGQAVGQALRRWPGERRKFLRTPPELSIIIPCYNYGHYLPDAINSLLGGPTCLGEWEPQSFQSFEIVIVDDASTDGSNEIVSQYDDPWRGIKTVLLSENKGTPGAINAGIEKAVGKYIHILSADDMRESWAVEKQYRAATENPGMAVYGNIQIFKQGERLKALRLAEYDFDNLLRRNCFPAGIMYPRTAWVETGGYPERMVHGREDWAFAVALGIKGYCGHKLAGLSGNLCRREGQNRSLTTKGGDWYRRFLSQIQSLYPDLYEGVRPVGCCGGGRNRSRRAQVARNAPAMAVLPGRDGSKLIEFVGAGSGSRTFWGPVTGHRYVFGDNDSDRIKYVDVADYKGFLDIYQGRKPQFSAYIAPDPEPEIPDIKDNGKDVKVKDEPVKVTSESADMPGTGDYNGDGDVDWRDQIHLAATIIEGENATPAAYKLAVEKDVNLRDVKGSGKNGRITKRDVQGWLSGIVA